MATFDEADGRITNALCGRTVEYVVRNGLDLELVCADGHTVVLASDLGHNVHLKRTDVSIALPGVTLQGGISSLGG